MTQPYNNCATKAVQKAETPSDGFITLQPKDFHHPHGTNECNGAFFLLNTLKYIFYFTATNLNLLFYHFIQSLSISILSIFISSTSLFSIRPGCLCALTELQ